MGGYRYYTRGREKSRCKTWSVPACLFLKLPFPQIPAALSLCILEKADPRAHWEKFVCQVNLRKIQEREEACIVNSWSLNFYPQKNQLLVLQLKTPDQMNRCTVGWEANERQDQAPFSEQHQGAQSGSHQDPKIVYWGQCVRVCHICFYSGHFILPLNILLYLCTERINFTQDNYELIQITPHKYEWYSVFWTGNTEKYKCTQ